MDLPLFARPKPRPKPRPTLEARFAAFDAANPHVYALFARFAAEARAAGRRKFSADAILHRIRWEMAVATRGDDFKVNNDFAAPYARKLMAERPEFAGFFETRRSEVDRP